MGSPTRRKDLTGSSSRTTRNSLLGGSSSADGSARNWAVVSGLRRPDAARLGATTGRLCETLRSGAGLTWSGGMVRTVVARLSWPADEDFLKNGKAARIAKQTTIAAT